MQSQTLELPAREDRSPTTVDNDSCAGNVNRLVRFAPDFNVSGQSPIDIRSDPGQDVGEGIDHDKFTRVLQQVTTTLENLVQRIDVFSVTYGYIFAR